MIVHALITALSLATGQAPQATTARGSSVPTFPFGVVIKIFIFWVLFDETN